MAKPIDAGDYRPPQGGRGHEILVLRKPAGKPLGQILVEEGVLQSNELQKLIDLQQSQPENERLPLGRLAVELGYLSDRKLRDLLDLHGKRLSLGELLVAQGHVTLAQLEAALEFQREQGGMLGEILVDQGLLDEITLTQVLAEQSDIPYIPLRTDDSWKKGLTTLINVGYSVKHGIVPVSQIGRILTVAIWHPGALGLQTELEQSTGLMVRFVLDVRGAIHERICDLYGVDHDELSNLRNPGPQASLSLVRSEPEVTGPFAQLGLDSEEAHVLEQVQIAASGVFLVCGLTPSRVEETYLSFLRYAKMAETARQLSEAPLDGRGEVKTGSDAAELFRDVPPRTLRLAIVAGGNTTAAVERMLNLGVRSDLLAESLTGVLAVCSIRRTCESCAEEYRPHRLVLSEWFGIHPVPRAAAWRRGMGCDECSGAGYRGEVTVSELWTPSAEDRDWIRAQAPGHVSSRRIREDLLGRVTGLGFKALQLAVSGHTTLEEVLKVLPPHEVRSVRGERKAA